MWIERLHVSCGVERYPSFASSISRTSRVSRPVRLKLRAMQGVQRERGLQACLPTAFRLEMTRRLSRASLKGSSFRDCGSTATTGERCGRGSGRRVIDGGVVHRWRVAAITSCRERRGKY